MSILTQTNAQVAGTVLSESKEMLDRVVERLKIDEGYRRHPYKDSEGIWTFGYGFNIEDGITKYEAEWLLRHRVEQRLDRLEEVIKGWDNLSINRKAALVNMSYQMGVPRLLKFTETLKLIAAGKHQEASIEMLNSVWAKETPNRAKRVSDMYRLG